ncbi:MAG: SurA N-terminal domain-containing protein [Desulfobacterales bacterium]|nr:SurA N-terminal domain-containing protein [Desulfobacterales bacterium]
MNQYYFKKILKNVIGCIIFTVIFSIFNCCLNIRAEGGEIIDRVAAVVNDDIITLYDLNLLLKPYEESIHAQGYPSEKETKMLTEIHEKLLNQLIDQKLADQESRRLKISVDEKEIDQAIETIKAAGNYTDEELKGELEKQGLKLEVYRRHIREQILQTKLVEFEIKSKIIISKEDIKSYYEAHDDIYGSRKKYHLRNILMKVSAFGGDQEKREVYKRMEAIREKLKNGQAFEDLARVYSESSLNAEGGDLGFFQIDELSPQLQAALKNLKAGGFTSVLDTDQGYQIFFIEEILETPGKSIEEVSSEIQQKLFKEKVSRKYRTWLEDLRNRAHLKIIE